MVLYCIETSLNNIEGDYPSFILKNMKFPDAAQLLQGNVLPVRESSYFEYKPFP